MTAFKVLLLRPDKAGDALKTLPVLRRAVNQRSDWEWHVLGSSHNFSLFETEPGIHAHLLPAGWETLGREAFLEQAGVNFPLDAAISLLCDPFDYALRILCHTRAERKYGVGPGERLQWEVRPLRLPKGPAGHCETQNIAGLISQALDIPLGEDFAPAAPVLTDSDRREADERMGAKAGWWLGFCPFAGLANRSQPTSRWKKFIHRAIASSPDDYRFFLFSGPAEAALLEEWRNTSVSPQNVTVCTPSSFRALGAYLKKLDGVVAVDSGPLHLARAVGVPSLGILSGGDWKRWFPRLGPRDRLVHRGTWDRFPSTSRMVQALRGWCLALNPVNPLSI